MRVTIYNGILLNKYVFNMCLLALVGHIQLQNFILNTLYHNYAMSKSWMESLINKKMTTKTNRNNGRCAKDANQGCLRILAAIHSVLPLCQIVLLINLATSFDAKKEHKMLSSRKSGLESYVEANSSCELHTPVERYV